MQHRTEGASRAAHVIPPTCDGQEPGTALAPDAGMNTITPTVPVIRISRSEDEVVLSIPRWCAASVAMAHRISARAIEILSHQAWDWESPRIKAGRSNLSAMILWWTGQVDDVHEHRVLAIMSALAVAAQQESEMRSVQPVGIVTHRVEVVA